VKCVIPESIFTWPREQVDARSWDAALGVVQQSLLGMAVANDVNDEEDRVLTAVFMECEELRAKKYLEVVTTNHKLAKKYAISLRTVTNWRKEGCPFEDGQWAVLDWMAERRHAPAGAPAKFGKQLSERKDKTVWAQINAEGRAAISEARRLKTAYQFQGLKPPDWLRGFRASR
jgi:aminoglycoside phosphotransferase